MLQTCAQDFVISDFRLLIPGLPAIQPPDILNFNQPPIHTGETMAVKVGINGFGRIGRNVVRAGLHNKNIEFVAVNDLTDTKTLAHLLKYDSVLGPLPETVTHDANSITVGGKTIKVFATKDPAELDWTSVGAQIVVESTGFFTDAKDASKHLKG